MEEITARPRRRGDLEGCRNRLTAGIRRHVAVPKGSLTREPTGKLLPCDRRRTIFRSRTLRSFPGSRRRRLRVYYGRITILDAQGERCKTTIRDGHIGLARPRQA